MGLASARFAIDPQASALRGLICLLLIHPEQVYASPVCLILFDVNDAFLDADHGAFLEDHKVALLLITLDIAGCRGQPCVNGTLNPGLGFAAVVPRG